jgi:hypothetical protein
MATTYEKIATQTLSSNATTIDFNSIPGTFTDIRLVVVALKQSGAANFYPYMQVNGDTASNYSMTFVRGNGSSSSTGRNTSVTEWQLAHENTTVNTPQLLTVDMFSYAGSTFKSCLVERNADFNGSGQVARQVGLWRSTSAITSISLFDPFGNGYGTGTIATLYGILKA